MRVAARGVTGAIAQPAHYIIGPDRPFFNPPVTAGPLRVSFPLKILNPLVVICNQRLEFLSQRRDIEISGKDEGINPRGIKVRGIQAKVDPNSSTGEKVIEFLRDVVWIPEFLKSDHPLYSR